MVTVKGTSFRKFGRLCSFGETYNSDSHYKFGQQCFTREIPEGNYQIVES